MPGEQSVIDGPREILKLFIGRSSRGTGVAEPVRRLISARYGRLSEYLQVPGKAARAMVKFGGNFQAWGSVPREEGAAPWRCSSPPGVVFLGGATLDSAEVRLALSFIK